MTPYETTRAYYAKWLGTQGHMLDEPGVFWVHTPARNALPAGYSHTMDVYAFVTGSTIILSYGDKAAAKIPELQGRLTAGMQAEEIRAVLQDVYAIRANHCIKYVYRGAEVDSALAVRLTRADFELYLDFFKKANANCGDTSWAEEYFGEIADKGYSHGVFADNQLVSATDAPDMSFMSEIVQEIGIHTLPAYRGRGYAKQVCLSCIKEMAGKGICPQWSAGAGNAGSQNLAASVGFVKYFDNLSVSL